MVSHDCRALAYRRVRGEARYNLPSDFTSDGHLFAARWDDVSVELNALSRDVLRDRIVSEVESRMDLDAFASAGSRRP